MGDGNLENCLLTVTLMYHVSLYNSPLLRGLLKPGFGLALWTRSSAPADWVVNLGSQN